MIFYHLRRHRKKVIWDLIFYAITISLRKIKPYEKKSVFTAYFIEHILYFMLMLSFMFFLVKELSELTMGTFKHNRRIRTARLIGKDLAQLYMQVEHIAIYEQMSVFVFTLVVAMTFLVPDPRVLWRDSSPFLQKNVSCTKMIKIWMINQSKLIIMDNLWICHQAWQAGAQGLETFLTLFIYSHILQSFIFQHSPYSLLYFSLDTFVTLFIHSSECSDIGKQLAKVLQGYDLWK